MSFAAMTTSAIALFLLGGLGYAYWEFQRYVAELPGRLEMKVFLKDEIHPLDVPWTYQAIKNLDGVESVVWVDPKDAWAETQAEMGDVVEGIGLENVYPQSFEVRLSELDRSDAIATSIQELRTIMPDGVSYLREEHELLVQGTSAVRNIGLVVGILLLVTSGILIYNTIRLTIVARAKEIRIMQLVGATRATVRLPMLVEGVIHGSVGGFLATLLIGSVHAGLNKLVNNLEAGAGLGPFPWPAILASLVLAGASYGAVCSWIAVREPRKVR